MSLVWALGSLLALWITRSTPAAFAAARAPWFIWMKKSASRLICTSAIFFRSAAKPAEPKMDSARKATAATVVRRKDGTALIEIPFLDVWHARPGTPRRLHHRHGIAACL